MPPRRRAFHCNDFGLDTTTIPRDAKRQAEPPSRQGTHSHQNHFRCNPSRRLVEPHTRFAASNAHPRLNLLPRRDFPAHAPIPGVAALPSSCPCRGCSRKTFNYYLSSIVPEGHPLNNPTQATKEHSVGRGGGTDTLSITPYKRRRSAVWGGTSAPTPSRGAGVFCHEARRIFGAKGRRFVKCHVFELLFFIIFAPNF